MNSEKSYNEGLRLFEGKSCEASFHLNTLDISHDRKEESVLKGFDDSFALLRQTKQRPPPCLPPYLKTSPPPSPICTAPSSQKRKSRKLGQHSQHTTSTPYHPCHESELPFNHALRKALFEEEGENGKMKEEEEGEMRCADVGAMETSCIESHHDIINMSVDDVSIHKLHNNDINHINADKNNIYDEKNSRNKSDNMNNNGNGRTDSLDVSDVMMGSYREGDSCLMPHCHTTSPTLPLHRGQHPDLRSISHDTMAAVLKGTYEGVLQRCVIVDCRYSYEYHGGHIKDSINVSNIDQLIEKFFPPHNIPPQPHNTSPQPHNTSPQPHNIPPQPHNTSPQPHNIPPQPHNTSPQPHNTSPQPHNIPPQPHNTSPQPHNTFPQPHNIPPQPHQTSPQPHHTLSSSQPPANLPPHPIIIFHCEFSSERAPKMMRHMRNVDRCRNQYPRLTYPEVYLLDGGYSLFFRHHSQLCQPINYVPMLQQAYSEQLRIHHCNNKQLQQRNNKLVMQSNISIFQHNLANSQH